jgi:hypothetical protein
LSAVYWDLPGYHVACEFVGSRLHFGGLRDEDHDTESVDYETVIDSKRVLTS